LIKYIYKVREREKQKPYSNPIRKDAKGLLLCVPCKVKKKKIKKVLDKQKNL
jgi:hypothetical protein